MGELVRERDLLPERVLCSTATRARETLELFAEGANFAGPIEFLDELYLAEPQAIVRAIGAHGGSAARVMVVGHNPGLEELVANLTAERTDLPTTAFVECSLPIKNWNELDLESAGRVRAMFRPKDAR
jgi:phosphohistidine phosphatase